MNSTRLFTSSRHTPNDNQNMLKNFNDKRISFRSNRFYLVVVVVCIWCKDHLEWVRRHTQLAKKKYALFFHSINFKFTNLVFVCLLLLLLLIPRNDSVCRCIWNGKPYFFPVLFTVIRFVTAEEKNCKLQCVVVTRRKKIIEFLIAFLQLAFIYEKFDYKSISRYR